MHPGPATKFNLPSWSSRATAGFGLIEFIIVIVLLGTIFLMALKGAAMIISIRAVITARQFEQLQVKVEAYRAAYGSALPGDDPRAPKRFGRAPAYGLLVGALVDETGNERIDGELSDFSSPDGEQFAAWRDLRFGGFLDGDVSHVGAAAMPENAFGGVFGFDEGNLGQKNTSICATKIPGRAAQMIDDQLDDGKISTGRLVATAKFSVEANNHFTSPDSEPYHIEKEYIICLPALP